MKILKRFGAILVNNLWLKVLAVITAFVVWVIVAQITNPVSTTTYSNVRVTLLGTDILESEGKVYQILNNSDVVKVTVRAPESVIGTLSADDISAVADLSQITENGTVPIIYTLDSAESIVADHSELQVVVEDKKTRYINIVYELVGSVGEGCVVGKVNLDRNRIEISGPESEVNRVAYAQVIIDLDGAVKSISADMEIVLYDSDGRKVESETIVKQTDYVTTTVTVLSTKTVPIYASVTGTPAPGYIYADEISVSPEVITIAGDTGVLSSINRIEITNPVDIGGATENANTRFDLLKFLPSGVTIEGSQYDEDGSFMVEVVAYVEKIAEKNVSLPLEKISITGIPSGFTAEIIEDGPVSVGLSGLRIELNAISSESLSGIAEIPVSVEDGFHDGQILIVPVSFTLSEHVDAEPVYVRIQLTEEEKDG
ncbi:MAG: hypothetical protein K5871_07785 [Lachnospiraceae bacterium]|nr:hypothetical protein [Lachnospiraceae bacterium]